jgi:transposase-like protein
MEWPRTPIEHLSRFQPPFCPRRDCREHRRRTPGYRFQRYGTYGTHRRRRIPRYRCMTCRRTYSRQAFTTSYYRKRPELLAPVAAGLVAGSALRQIARSVGCAPNTAARIAAHLGRHTMLLQASAMAALEGRLDEELDLDHFESFEYTQDYPFGIATPVGTTSWFIFTVDPAPHGRAGARTAAQEKRLRQRPKRRTYGGYEGSTRRVLDDLLALCPPGAKLHLVCDGHPAISRAVRRHPQADRIDLGCYPNPTAQQRRDGSKTAHRRDTKMFAVDLLHKIVRHSSANHKRETIAFSRRLNAAMERFFVTVVWRNFIQPKSERRRCSSPTPAMQVGLTGERWSWKRLLSKRLFFDRIELSEVRARLYRREWITPVLASNARHQARLAF